MNRGSEMLLSTEAMKPAFFHRGLTCSAAIAERKCADACTTGADAIVGGDLGCLLNIEGKLRRMGDEKTRVLHVAEVLAGDK